MAITAIREVTEEMEGMATAVLGIFLGLKINFLLFH
jgi:hypothetical protein